MGKDINDVFMDELQDILSSEEQIVKALPKMVAAAESKELKDAFTSHLKETKHQIQRLEKAFKLLKTPKKEKFCKATKGLIQECEDVIKEYKRSTARDAALIAKAQRIEHYEISAYGTARALAKELNHKDVAALLKETEKEEAHADKKLTKIAMGGIFKNGLNHEAHLIEEKSQPKKTSKVAKKSTAKKAVAKKTSSKKTSHKKTAKAKKAPAAKKKSSHTKTIKASAKPKRAPIKQKAKKIAKKLLKAVRL